MFTFDIDRFFMQEAIKQARLAREQDEVPVGAVLVRGQQCIAKAHNQVETLKDPTAHAEMIALTQATHTLGQKWLQGCCLYVTLEPCSMCAGALVLARLGRLVFGVTDLKSGACGSIIDITSHPRLNHRVPVQGGLCEETCGGLLTDFFAGKRRRRNPGCKQPSTGDSPKDYA